MKFEFIVELSPELVNFIIEKLPVITTQFAYIAIAIANIT